MEVNNSGWIKLHRSIVDWEWYTDINTKTLFLHLILKANYTRSKWRGEVSEIGTLMSGSKKLATETGLTRQKVRTAIANLEKTGEITTSSGPKYTVFSITNYGIHQVGNLETTTEPTTNQPAGQPPINQQDNHCLKKIRKKEDKKQTTEPTTAIAVVEKVKKKPVCKYTDEHMRFARFMIDEIRTFNPGHKEPNIESWADQVRLMIERDGRDLRKSAEIFRWASNDSFWQGNVLSPKKLREQWDKLAIKSSQPTRGGNNGNNQQLNASERSDAKFQQENGITADSIERNAWGDESGPELNTIDSEAYALEDFR